MKLLGVLFLVVIVTIQLIAADQIDKLDKNQQEKLIPSLVPVLPPTSQPRLGSTSTDAPATSGGNEIDSKDGLPLIPALPIVPALLPATVPVLLPVVSTLLPAIPIVPTLPLVPAVVPAVVPVIVPSTPSPTTRKPTTHAPTTPGVMTLYRTTYMITSQSISDEDVPSTVASGVIQTFSTYYKVDVETSSDTKSYTHHRVDTKKNKIPVNSKTTYITSKTAGHFDLQTDVEEEKEIIGNTLLEKTSLFETRLNTVLDGDVVVHITGTKIDPEEDDTDESLNSKNSSKDPFSDLPFWQQMAVVVIIAFILGCGIGLICVRYRVQKDMRLELEKEHVEQARLQVSAKNVETNGSETGSPVTGSSVGMTSFNKSGEKQHKDESSSSTQQT